MYHECSCAGPADCSGSTLNCGLGWPCIISCNAKDACRTATIRSNGATTVTMSCDGDDACFAADFQCGTGDCYLGCNSGNEPCKDMLTANVLTLSPNSFQCGGSQCPGNIVSITFTAAPTYSPSASPSAAPTIAPVDAPTFFPTDSPTSAPVDAPTSAPTQPPTTAPTVPPTAAPSKAPTLSPGFPSAAPSNAPSKTPSAAPTTPPTLAPTLAPTEAPSKLLPTLPPTNSDNQVFIDKMGIDNGCCNNQTTACLSIQYAYNSFLGNNGCDLRDSDGNGVINLGDGHWYWPYDLIYDDEEVIITGNGMDNTFLYYNDLTGMGCKWRKCWLEINNLTLKANESGTMDSKQINIYQGGTLKFGSVLFDGNNYAQNQQGNPLWDIRNDRVSVIFDSCIFKNHHSHGRVEGGATLEIIDSHFENCTLNDAALLVIKSQANLYLKSASFDSLNGQANNYIISVRESLFYASNSTFANNTNFVAIIDAQDSIMNIRRSIFAENQADHVMAIGEYQSRPILTHCPLNDINNVSTVMISNRFIENNVISVIESSQVNMYMQNNLFNQNQYTQYEMNVVNTSLSIDINNSTLSNDNQNFLQFSTDTDEILCINGEDIVEISKYLTFGINTNISNTKVIFNDCIDEFDPQSIELTIPTSNLNASEQYILNAEAGGAVLQSFECFDNVTSCAINCDAAVSCFSSTFILNSPITTINCGSDFACGYGTINASYDYNHLESLHIICDDQSSCVNTRINVESIYDFHLDCIQIGSCSQLTVNMRNISNSSIACYELSNYYLYIYEQ